jgi:hypothetical protein
MADVVIKSASSATRSRFFLRPCFTRMWSKDVTSENFLSENEPKP